MLLPTHVIRMDKHQCLVSLLIKLVLILYVAKDLHIRMIIRVLYLKYYTHLF